MASQDAAGDAVPTMLDGDSPALLKYSGAAWAMLFGLCSRLARTVRDHQACGTGS